MTTPALAYNHAPSRELQGHLFQDGFLSPIVKLAGVIVGGHYHDVYFRRDDKVDVYRGQTILVRIQKTGDGEVNLTAHPTYRNQPCAQSFLRRWRVDEPGFDEKLDHYLNNVKVNPSFLRGEGKVQEQWSQVKTPWVPFDCEGLLEGPHEKGTDFLQIQEALGELNVLSQHNRWASPNPTASKIDQLAIDQQGRLVLLELKDASKRTSEVYYSPFQLLQYIWEWHTALEAVRDDLQAIIRARVAVGLTPPDVPPLTGGIRAAVGFGPDKRSDEVKRRYQATLHIVNNHLPADVAPIETWAFTDTGPRLVT